MKEISRAKKLEVAQYYILGYHYSAIENATGVSHGSIVNIVKELEYSKLTIPGTSFDQMNDLRQLSFRLKKERMEPSQALLGLILFDRLRVLEITPELVAKWSELAKKLLPVDFPSKDFLEAALRLNELEIASYLYGYFKDKTGARRIRGENRQEVRIGPTAASKILFAIRPKALMPWDEAMRVDFKCVGSPQSYVKYLKTIRNLTFHIRNLCQNKGFQIDRLPHKLGRTDSTVLALLNEYIWVTETRKVKLPSSETFAQWVSLG